MKYTFSYQDKYQDVAELHQYLAEQGIAVQGITLAPTELTVDAGDTTEADLARLLTAFQHDPNFEQKQNQKIRREQAKLTGNEPHQITIRAVATLLHGVLSDYAAKINETIDAAGLEVEPLTVRPLEHFIEAGHQLIDSGQMEVPEES